MSNYQLHRGDCLTFMRTLDRGTVDCVVTDPPYNIGYGYDEHDDGMDADDYFEWQLDVVSECARVLKPGGALLYLNYPEFASRLFWAAREVCDLMPFKIITWTYNTHTGGKPLRRGTRSWLWWVCGQSEPGYIGADAVHGVYQNPTDKRVAQLIARGVAPVDYDWWHFEQVKNVSDEKTAHPCQLPLGMVRRVVKLACPAGGIVLDPFSGSGTTGAAAMMERLGFLGCESSKAYFAIAEKRIRQAAENYQPPLFAPEPVAVPQNGVLHF